MITKIDILRKFNKDKDKNEKNSRTTLLHII